jgi:hypothetical protein
MKTLEEMTKEELQKKLIEVRKRKMDCTRRRIEEKILKLLKHLS